MFRILCPNRMNPDEIGIERKHCSLVISTHPDSWLLLWGFRFSFAEWLATLWSLLDWYRFWQNPDHIERAYWMAACKQASQDPISRHERQEVDRLCRSIERDSYSPNFGPRAATWTMKLTRCSLEYIPEEFPELLFNCLYFYEIDTIFNDSETHFKSVIRPAIFTNKYFNKCRIFIANVNASNLCSFFELKSHVDRAQANFFADPFFVRLI